MEIFIYDKNKYIIQEILFLYEKDNNNTNAVPHHPIDDSQGAYGGE